MCVQPECAVKFFRFIFIFFISVLAFLSCYLSFSISNLFLSPHKLYVDENLFFFHGTSRSERSKVYMCMDDFDGDSFVLRTTCATGYNFNGYWIWFEGVFFCRLVTLCLAFTGLRGMATEYHLLCVFYFLENYLPKMVPKKNFFQLIKTSYVVSVIFECNGNKK